MTASSPRMPGPIAGNGERILVVEDEPAFAELIALWLERHGWQAEIAPDGPTPSGARPTRPT